MKDVEFTLPDRTEALAEAGEALGAAGVGLLAGLVSVAARRR